MVSFGGPVLQGCPVPRYMWGANGGVCGASAIGGVPHGCLCRADVKSGDIELGNMDKNSLG